MATTCSPIAIRRGGRILDPGGSGNIVEVTVRFRTDHADGLQAAIVRHPDGRDVEVFLALDSRIQRAA